MHGGMKTDEMDKNILKEIMEFMGHMNAEGAKDMSLEVRQKDLPDLKDGKDVDVEVLPGDADSEIPESPSLAERQANAHRQDPDLEGSPSEEASESPEEEAKEDEDEEDFMNEHSLRGRGRIF